MNRTQELWNKAVVRGEYKKKIREVSGAQDESPGNFDLDDGGCGEG